MTDLPDTPTVETFARDLRAGRISAADLTDECLRRIDAGHARLNAFILVLPEQARRQARDADRELAAGVDRGPLHGVPVSVKDIIDVAGTPTSCASRVRAGHLAEADARAIAHLRRAGAVIIGKTNLHEFALGTTNEESAFGPARNPYDASRSPGGSSGGSAASVAAGMALASLGTDTGGSIRIPASACGIVGLKPTYGEVSVDGVVPLSRSLDHVGPLARSVADAAMLYGVLVGDTTAKPPTAAPLGSLRLAVPRRYFCELLDEEVEARFDEAVARLRAGGATIGEVAIEHTAEIAPVYTHLTLPEAAAVHASTLERQPELYTPPVRLRLEMGGYILAEDYARARVGQDVLTREVDAALARCDALMLPTLPIPAPLLGAPTVEVHGVSEAVRTLTLRLTQLFNITGHPAISLPCGLTSAGLPCGLQLVGRRMRTPELLVVALACEPVVRARREM